MADDRERLHQMLREGGVVQDQTFYFSEPLPVKIEGVPKVSFLRCNFLWSEPVMGAFFEGDKCKEFRIEECLVADIPALKRRIALTPELEQRIAPDALRIVSAPDQS